MEIGGKCYVGWGLTGRYWERSECGRRDCGELGFVYKRHEDPAEGGDRRCSFAVSLFLHHLHSLHQSVFFFIFVLPRDTLNRVFLSLSEIRQNDQGSVDW